MEIPFSAFPCVLRGLCALRDLCWREPSSHRAWRCSLKAGLGPCGAPASALALVTVTVSPECRPPQWLAPSEVIYLSEYSAQHRMEEEGENKPSDQGKERASMGCNNLPITRELCWPIVAQPGAGELGLSWASWAQGRVHSAVDFLLCCLGRKTPTEGWKPR